MKCEEPGVLKKKKKTEKKKLFIDSVHYALLYRETSEVTTCEPAAAPEREAVFERGCLTHVDHICDALLPLGGARCGAKIAPVDEGMG